MSPLLLFQAMLIAIMASSCLGSPLGWSGVRSFPLKKDSVGDAVAVASDLRTSQQTTLSEGTTQEVTEILMTTKQVVTEAPGVVKQEVTEEAVSSTPKPTEGPQTKLVDAKDTVTAVVVTEGLVISKPVVTKNTTNQVTEGALVAKEDVTTYKPEASASAVGSNYASSSTIQARQPGGGFLIPLPISLSSIQDNDLKQEEEKKSSHDSVVWGILPLIDDDGNKKSVFFINNFYDSKTQEFPDDGKTLEEKIKDFNRWRSDLTLVDKFGSGALAALVGGG